MEDGTVNGMRWVGLALGVSLTCAAAEAWADSTPAQGYALVVGSNVGGPGQGTLRYAEQDASRVAELLHTLGGYEAARIERLVQPSAANLRAALERIRAQIEPLSQSGEQARFFFYYSGHARADALNLGAEQLALTELRQRIVALPATLSIVVLDGCQSGAFSRVKGADKAADFAWNSLTRLNSQGIAVVASSSAKELSQESDELRSGYFTHHWLVALRGGGDRDADGRVTLSEAYQYAYSHTLANTAQTAVGEQHATLETNIRGKDDIALTQPALASTRLRIASELSGRVLIQRLPSWSVWAELDKVASAPVLLALPAGDYVVTLRRGSQVARCTISLREGAEFVLGLAQCSNGVPPGSAAKGPARSQHEANLAASTGAQVAGLDGDEGWLLEFAFGPGGGHRASGYVRRLRDFGFDSDRFLELSPRFMLNVQRRLHANVAVGVSYFNLHSDEFERNIEVEQSFRWNAHAVGPYVQADLRLGRRRLIGLYLRLGAGLSVAWTDLDAVVPISPVEDLNPSFQETTSSTREVTQHYVRSMAWISGGMHFTPWRHVGFTFEARYALAPALENEFGETQDVGGFSMLFGAHLRSWE